LDVVPLDICGIVLGILYPYEKKSIFFIEHNEYHLTKNGIKYIVRAHRKMSNLPVVTIRKLKGLVMQEIMFHSCLQKQLKGVHCDLEHKDERVEFVSNYEVF